MIKWFDLRSRKTWITLLLIAVFMTVLSVTAFAGSDPGSVTVRIEGRTETFVPPTQVTIQDFNLTDYGITNPTGEGMTALQAVIKALEARGYNPKDTSQFAFESSGYMTKLCGLATGSYNYDNSLHYAYDGWMFSVNDQYVDVGINDKYVQDGDSIIVYFTESWMDSGYGYFDQTDVPVFNGDFVTLTLTSSVVQYGYSGYTVIETPCADADVYINGEPSGKQTDAGGRVMLEFDEAGEYVVSAEKRVDSDEYGYYDVEDINVISRPYSLVTCSDYATVRVEGADSTLIASEKVAIDTEGDTTALEALTAALEENGYDPTSADVLGLNTVGGTYITSILGLTATESGGWMYTLNDTSPWFSVDQQTLANGDDLVFYYLEDYTATSYAVFDEDAVTVERGQPLTFTLSRMEFDESWNAVLVPCAGATIMIDGEPSAYETDEDGQVTFAFDWTGYHTLCAEKFSGEANTISRPYCAVTVTGSDLVDENSLSQLNVSVTPSFTPAFSSPLKSYDLELDYTVSSLDIATATLEADSTVEGHADWWEEDETVSLSNSGGSYQLSDIPYGQIAFSITVTPADKTIPQQTYKLTIDRPNPVVLENLKVSAGNLGVFDGEESKYSFSVSNGVEQIIVTPTAHEAADVTVDGEEVASGTASQAIALEEGIEKTITIVVSAEGLESNTYLLNVTRKWPMDFQTKIDMINDVLSTVSASYEDTYDDWPVMDMAFHGQADEVNQNAFLGVARSTIQNSTLATDLERTAIVLTSLGYDASGFDNGSGQLVDIISEIANLDSLGTMNGYLFALLAYYSGAYTVDGPWNRDALIDYILAAQIQSGGNSGAWRLSSGASANVDVTAMVISALSPYYGSDADVKAAVDEALTWLGTKQSDEGSFVNSNSTAMVLIALTCLGYDGDSYFAHSVIDGLLSFVTEDNFIGYADNRTKNALSTEQGFCALAAYYQYIDNGGEAVSPYRFAPPTKDGSEEVTVDSLSLAQMPDQTSYAIGESFDPQGLIISAHLSDGSEESVDIDALTFFGFDSVTSGTKTVKVSYQGAQVMFQVTVRASSSGETSNYAYIRVAEPRGKTYLAKTKLTIEDNETAFSLLTKTGLYYVADTKSGYGTYVQTIEDLSEFDITPESGWMYSVNGVFLDISSDSYGLDRGDYVQWLYTRDMGADLGADSESTGSEGTPKSVETTDDSQIQTGSASFRDLPQTHWAYGSIGFLVERGILDGRPDGSFGPNDPVTRAELVKILAAAFAPNWQPSGDTKFSDVAGDAWYEPYVLWAEQSGVTQGDNGKFNPNAAISRQDLATMIVRCLTAQKISLAQGSKTVTFADEAQIASYAQSAVELLAKSGVINGGSNGKFAPAASATRAETAKIIATLLQMFGS